GLRLKGNSSLRGLTTETAENPEALPWLIRLDKFVDDQAHQGVNDIVIRSNSTDSAMNEAVALELLGETGLATEAAVSTSFTVNDGTSELRLAIENPDKVWDAANFDTDGLLYKADSEGDYSYRGDDAASYEDVFDQEVGDDDLEPLTDFLQFINESDDETFAAELGEWLDVDSFATYLAFQDLIGNFDDIDGPGNNSYLRYDLEAEQFTVVNWDLNLAFNTANVGGGGGGAAGGGGGRPGGPPIGGAVPDGAPVADGEVPEGAPVAQGERPAGAPAGAAGGADAADAPGGGAGGRSNGNILSQRFLADDDFSRMYDEATAELTEVLFTDGTAEQILANWVTTLQSDAGDLIDEATVEADASAIREQFPTS
ncbi:MAG: CotH kinase family protein, partial [Microthrixaceae bacterium]|nr:CotH kinase family protein [Microthrixaceae bacterium]